MSTETTSRKIVARGLKRGMMHQILTEKARELADQKGAIKVSAALSEPGRITFEKKFTLEGCQVEDMTAKVIIERDSITVVTSEVCPTKTLALYSATTKWLQGFGYRQRPFLNPV